MEEGAPHLGLLAMALPILMVVTILLGVAAGWIIGLNYIQALVAAAAIIPAILLCAAVSDDVYGSRAPGGMIGLFLAALLVGLPIGSSFRWSWREPAP